MVFSRVEYRLAFAMSVSSATISRMNKRIAAYIVALLAGCFNFDARAQPCHTVRDKDGAIVYQSIRPPVDTSVPYKYEIEALFPGGYMQIDQDFFRCGNYERPTPKISVAPTPTTKPPVQEPANGGPNLFENLAPNPIASAATPVVPAQPPTDNSFGEIMPKMLAAGLIVGIFLLPKRARNVTLSLIAGIFVLAIGFAVYESARPSPQPFAQCVIDRAPLVQNTPALRAALDACIDRNPGGWNARDFQIYVRGSAKGWGTPKSRSDCVTRHASNTSNENVAQVIFMACDCLYATVTEDKPDGTNSYLCGSLP
jgi:hypothetical protein